MKSGCLIIVIAIMLFLTYISIKQGFNTIYNDNWDNNYLKQKAVVTSIYKDSSYMMSNGTGSWNCSFEPVVRYTFNNTVKTDTLIWHRSTEKSKFYPGDSIAIVISKIDGNPTKAADQDRIATGIVNLLQGIFFFFVAYFSFHYFRKLHKKNIKMI
jgi:hypothetical protein